MAFSDLEQKHCERELARFMEQRRPPLHIRSQVDLGYRIHGQSIEVFEVRPAWRDPTSKTETPIAKVTYVRTKDRWRVFWMRADLKWHRYNPSPEVPSLQESLDIVDRDEYGCFFG